MDQLRLGDLEIKVFKIGNKNRAFLAKVLGCLEPEYFESKVFKLLFRQYKEYFKIYDDIPSKEISKRWLKKTLDEDDAFINAILDDIFIEGYVPKESEKQYLLDEITIFAKRAKMKEAIIKSVDLVQENKFDEITELMTSALKFNIDVKLGYDLYDVDGRYAAIRDSLENKMSTGFTQLDDVLGGGWARKEINCVLGPPGMGKSIFLVNLGFLSLMKQYNVVHYSFEMSEERLGLRYDAVATSLAQKDLFNHPDKIKERYRGMKAVSKARLRIKEFPTATASIYDLEAHLEQLKMYEGFVPDIVIVDYGDIMKSVHQSKNTYEEQGWIFRELRGMAIKRNVVMLTATQAKRDSLDPRGGTKEVVGMDQVADSMEKNRILDSLFSIVQSKNLRQHGKIGLFVAKNRNGEANKALTFNINYATMKLTECQDAQVAKEIEKEFSEKDAEKETKNESEEEV